MLCGTALQETATVKGVKAKESVMDRIVRITLGNRWPSKILVFFHQKFYALVKVTIIPNVYLLQVNMMGYFFAMSWSETYIIENV